MSEDYSYEDTPMPDTPTGPSQASPDYSYSGGDMGPAPTAPGGGYGQAATIDNNQYVPGGDLGPGAGAQISSSGQYVPGGDLGPGAAAAQNAGASGQAALINYLSGTPKSEGDGIFTQLMKGSGILNKDGKLDLSDPNSFDRLMRTISVGGTILQTLQGPQNQKSPQQLQQQFKGPFDQWNPTQQAAADKYFNNPNIGHSLNYAHTMGSPIVPSRRYAAGGPVEGSVDDSNPQFMSQGALSLVKGPGGGQDDLVPARLANGEYVHDADFVSALGDGSNEHGAKILDKLRELVRAHKRSASPDKIPPKTKSIMHYLSKAKTEVGKNG
jgi:hypothetical protein